MLGGIFDLFPRRIPGIMLLPLICVMTDRSRTLR